MDAAWNESLIFLLNLFMDETQTTDYILQLSLENEEEKFQGYRKTLINPVWAEKAKSKISMNTRMSPLFDHKPVIIVDANSME